MISSTPSSLRCFRRLLLSVSNIFLVHSQRSIRLRVFVLLITRFVMGLYTPQIDFFRNLSHNVSKLLRMLLFDDSQGCFQHDG